MKNLLFPLVIAAIILTVIVNPNAIAAKKQSTAQKTLNDNEVVTVDHEARKNMAERCF